MTRHGALLLVLALMTAPGCGSEPDPTDASPFAGMDPEMAANPQPMFKALRDSRPGQARAIAFVPKNCRPFIFSFMFD